MLPPISKLNELGGAEDMHMCEDQLEVKFLHNIAPHMTDLNKMFDSPAPNVFELLSGFFTFYSEFNFNLKQLNPITGETQPKDSGWNRSSAMNIVNPLGNIFQRLFLTEVSNLKDFFN